MFDSRVARIWIGIVVFSIGLHGTIPLARTYRSELGASTGDLTLLYSLYAFALIPALVLFGATSDHIGRRRVVVPSMVLTTVASLMFAGGHSLAVLFVARSVQGWATGMFWGAASAFLLDHVDVRRRLDASLVLSATFMGSIAAGIFLFGVGVALTGSATRTWLIHVVLMVGATSLVATVPEVRGRDGRRPPITVAMPSKTHRRAFFRFVVPATFALIGLGAYVVALGPTFVEEVRPASSVGVQGASVAVALAVGAAMQLATRPMAVARVTGAGAVMMPVGGAVLVAAVWAQSYTLAIVGLGAVGGGMGLTFRGLFATVEQMTTPIDRAGVISTFSIVFYLANGLPVVAGGYAVGAFGLGAVTAALTVTVTCVVACAFAGRARSARGIYAT